MRRTRTKKLARVFTVVVAIVSDFYSCSLILFKPNLFALILVVSLACLQFLILTGARIILLILNNGATIGNDFYINEIFTNMMTVLIIIKTILYINITLKRDKEKEKLKFCVLQKF